MDKETNSLLTYVSRLLEAYSMLNKKVEALQEEVAILKGEEPEKPTIHDTKYPHMKVLTRI